MVASRAGGQDAVNMQCHCTNMIYPTYVYIFGWMSLLHVVRTCHLQQLHWDQMRVEKTTVSFDGTCPSCHLSFPAWGGGFRHDFFQPSCTSWAESLGLRYLRTARHNNSVCIRVLQMLVVCFSLPDFVGWAPGQAPMQGDDFLRCCIFSSRLVPRDDSPSGFRRKLFCPSPLCQTDFLNCLHNTNYTFTYLCDWRTTFWPWVCQRVRRSWTLSCQPWSSSRICQLCHDHYLTLESRRSSYKCVPPWW